MRRRGGADAGRDRELGGRRPSFYDLLQESPGLLKLLTPFGTKAHERVAWRVGLTLVGAALFCAAYPRLPTLAAVLFPMVGGIGCGLSGTYR